MNKIVRLTQRIEKVLDCGMIGYLVHFEVGDLFYVEKNYSGDFCYYPLCVGYPISTATVPEISEITELVEETEKERGYYLHKKYTQYEVDLNAKLIKDLKTLQHDRNT